MSRLHASQVRLTSAGSFATHVDEHGAKHIVISKLLGRTKLIITETYIAAGSRLQRLKATDRRPALGSPRTLKCV